MKTGHGDMLWHHRSDLGAIFGVPNNGTVAQFAGGNWHVSRVVTIAGSGVVEFPILDYAGPLVDPNMGTSPSLLLTGCYIILPPRIAGVVPSGATLDIQLVNGNTGDANSFVMYDTGALPLTNADHLFQISLPLQAPFPTIVNPVTQPNLLDVKLTPGGVLSSGQLRIVVTGVEL